MILMKIKEHKKSGRAVIYFLKPSVIILELKSIVNLKRQGNLSTKYSVIMNKNAL